MAIIGFNLSKINAELKKKEKGGVKINTNIKINSLDKASIALDEKMGALKANFTYTVSYDPGVGLIELQGDILSMQENKTVDAVVKEWNEKKSVPRKLTTILMTHIMQKCSMQALIMARDVSLPPPVPLPKFKAPTVAPEKKAPAKKK